MAGNRYWLLLHKLHLKFDRAPRSYSEMHLDWPVKYQCSPHIETSQLICCANQLTGFCMRATLSFNGLRQESVPSVISMFKISKKNTWTTCQVYSKNDRTTSGASIVNFEHISHFILLLILLNSNKSVPVGPEKR